jgi:hypothetical protein
MILYDRGTVNISLKSLLISEIPEGEKTLPTQHAE